jgi:hypothetical protein
MFSPSNIIRRDDGYYYVMSRAEQYGRQKRGACLLRTDDLAAPDSWRAWDGSDFSVRFADPYVGQPEPSEHVCEPVSPDEIFNMHESLTYNTYLEKYLLVGVAPGRTTAGRETYGIHYSVSDDLRNWTQRKLIREVEAPGTFKCGDLNPILYPSIIDPESDSRNFETSGRRPFMYFTRFHYQDCVQGPNRDLVRVRVEFNK